MKRILTILLITAVLTPLTFAQEGMTKAKTNQTVEQAADRLESLIKDKGLNVFCRVNHQKNAESVGLEMRPTILLIFGNPKVGTPLMKCAQTVAIDLPQKFLVWQDENGQTWIGYNDPSYLAKRHDISDCEKPQEEMAKALSNFAKAAAKSLN